MNYIKVNIEVTADRDPITEGFTLHLESMLERLDLSLANIERIHDCIIKGLNFNQHPKECCIWLVLEKTGQHNMQQEWVPHYVIKQIKTIELQ